MLIEINKPKPLNFPGPSTKQKDYMMILFNDLGFTFNSRNAWLGAELKRKISHLDDIKYFEASGVIDRLKGIRESQKGRVFP